MAARVPRFGRGLSRFPRCERTSHRLWGGCAKGDFGLTVLDTNVIIHYFKGDAHVVSHLAEIPPAEVAIPTVVAYEIEYGTLRSRLSAQRRRQIEVGLKSVRQAPFDREAAMASAHIRIALEKRGLTIGPIDILIAGTALSLGAVLVTNNTAEFSRVPGLRITDWTA